MKRKKHKHRWMKKDGNAERMCDCGLIEKGEWTLAASQLFEYCTLGNKVMAIRVNGALFAPVKTK